MKKLIKLRGFLAESDTEYKRIKILYNGDDPTEHLIRQHIKEGCHNPIFAGGFWIKYTGKTKFYSSCNVDGIKNINSECTLSDIKDNHVIIEAYINNYSYPTRTGWYISSTDIIKCN